MTTPPDPKEEIDEHLPAMRAFAISLTRDSASADDMVQEALVKAWSNVDSFEPGTNMRAWLFTILRNVFYSSRRKACREVPDTTGSYTESLSQKPDHDGRLHFSEFGAAFARLPDEQREALILVGACRFSYDEVAAMCGGVVGTIKIRVNRGRARLSDLMQLDEDETMELTDPATMAVVADPVNGGTD